MAEDDNDFLKLSLSSSSSSSSYRPRHPLPRSPPPPLELQAFFSQPALQLSPTHPLFLPLPQPTHALPPPSHLSSAPPSSSSSLRRRRNPARSPPPPIPPPFPWATARRATVHTFQYLIDNRIRSISGDVQCKRCERSYRMEFDLCEKFGQVAKFIEEERNTMYDRAPECWMNSVLPSCRFCLQENSVKPVMAEKKKNINWLFLFLGQMLGCCTLEQLKYFCKHTRNHRTGAKDRVLYLTYLTLWRQIVPNGSFEYYRE